MSTQVPVPDPSEAKETQMEFGAEKSSLQGCARRGGESGPEKSRLPSRILAKLLVRACEGEVLRFGISLCTAL